MEARLQQFIESVETLADVRNLDVFNPVVFQMEHPLTGVRYTVAGSKVEPSYLGIPVNTTWVVLDPASTYFRQALKLKDTLDTDTVSDMPQPDGQPSLWWHVVRTYDEIFEDPQYYMGLSGIKGDKGDKGDPGEPGPAPDMTLFVQTAIGRLSQLAGSLSIIGPTTVTPGSDTSYTLELTESKVDENGALTLETRAVLAPITLVSAAPDGTSMKSGNVLQVGSAPAGTVLKLYAVYPSWTKMVAAELDVGLDAATVDSLNINGVATVYAGSNSTYTATVTSSDGTTAPAPVLWSISGVDGIASIDASTGQLTTQTPITADTIATITAVYSVGGVTLTATKDVSIKKLLATGIVINGPASVAGGGAASYTATLTLNSGTSQTVVPIWTLTGSGASITASGVLTADNVDDSITLRAEYLFPGSASPVTATKTVSITKVVTPIYPYYGTGTALPADWQTFVTSLPYRGAEENQNANVAIDCLGSDTYMYFAYPASYGEAQFFDVLSMFYGGWGGAGNSGQGPSSATLAAGADKPLLTNITVDGNSVPFYIYRSDFANLGPASANKWTVSAAPV